MNLTKIVTDVQHRVATLGPDTPERQLFETWATACNASGWELDFRRRRNDPTQYTNEQLNKEFEAFVLGLMCEQESKA